MGCIWSNEVDARERGLHRYEKRQLSSQPQVRPCFGEYRCPCGRTWSSRLSWAHGYQICIRCKRSVYAHSQRKLRPSDMSVNKDNIQEHQRELCQMCQQLGFNCGEVNRSAKHGLWTRRQNKVNRLLNNVYVCG